MKISELLNESQGMAEGSLKEFAPGSGGGESGRWYTDDEMTDIVGDGWWQDMDVSGANIGVIDSEVPKEYMIQQAQAWLDDQGYSVEVLNCRVNDDDMEWYIEGSFHNPGFAKKGVAEGLGQHIDTNRPARILAKNLKNLDNLDYETIDKLMKAISKKYNLSNDGKDLHVMFAKLYGHNPDYWIRKEKGVDEGKQRLDPHCWTGYKKQGTKMKGGTRVNNCVPKESAIMMGIKV